MAITNEHYNRLVHKWRTEEDAILVGTQTVILDNPQLTARFWSGRNPVRICIDRNLKLPAQSRIFDIQAKTIVVNGIKDSVENNLIYSKVDFGENIVPQLFGILCQHEIQSVIVEGGTKTINSFLSLGLWDEARVFTGSKEIGAGVKAPQFSHNVAQTESCNGVKLDYYYNTDYYVQA